MLPKNDKANETANTPAAKKQRPDGSDYATRTPCVSGDPEMLPKGYRDNRKHDAKTLRTDTQSIRTDGRSNPHCNRTALKPQSRTPAHSHPRSRARPPHRSLEFDATRYTDVRMCASSALNASNASNRDEKRPIPPVRVGAPDDQAALSSEPFDFVFYERAVSNFP